MSQGTKTIRINEHVRLDRRERSSKWQARVKLAQRYERGSILITSNLPFEEWTETFGTDRLTSALLDRLTHHVNILEMNGESYRLNQSKSRIAKT